MCEKSRFQSFVPVPDTLLAKAAAEKELETSIQPGLETPFTGERTTTDLTAVGPSHVTPFLLCSRERC